MKNKFSFNITFFLDNFLRQQHKVTLHITKCKNTNGEIRAGALQYSEEL